MVGKQMDIGVGSFVVANALVSRQARNLPPSYVFSCPLPNKHKSTVVFEVYSCFIAERTAFCCSTWSKVGISVLAH